MSLRLCSAAIVAACVTASLVPAIAGAQAPDSAKRGGLRPRLAAGVDAMLYDDTQRIPSLYAITGFEWVHPRAPFSARFDVSYFRRDFERERLDCTDFCVYGSRSAAVGISADGRYTFLSRAPMRPYLVSGFGLYHTTTASTLNMECTQFACMAGATGRRTFRNRDVGPGLHAGFGFAFPIRRSELTLEFLYRQHMVDFGRYRTMPITLGIRF
jgi:hypothetical protein